MRVKITSLLITALVILSGCAKTADSGPAGNSRAVSEVRPGSPESGDSSQQKPEPTPPIAKDGDPRTIRDFFMLLPEKYFVLEGCDREKDRDCRQAKLDYLKTFTEVEDAANGYLKGGCDGAQSCLEMTIFKRPAGTYLVAVSTEAEMMIEQYFLDHQAGQWTDISAKVIPEFGKDKIYELPRRGTTVQVFAKKVTEKGDDYEVAEKGARLYDLIWNDGKFSISK